MLLVTKRKFKLKQYNKSNVKTKRRIICKMLLWFIKGFNNLFNNKNI